MSKRTVVVTGIGLVSPLGCDIEKVWKRLTEGESGVGRVTRVNPDDYPSKVAAEVIEYNVDDFVEKKKQRRMDRFCQLGIGAANLAVKNSGIDFSTLESNRAGIVIGSGIGGLYTMEIAGDALHGKADKRFSPFLIPMMITNILAGEVAIEHGIRGPNFCITSACATATHSLGESMRMIQNGEVDVMLAGGAEAPVCDFGVGGFAAMRALSTLNDPPEKASRPFDMNRNGFVIGEGAAVLVLEELEHAKKRGAHIYCELAGYGRTCDAYHITAPIETAEGATRGMILAYEDAGLNAEDIDYVNAHGTSTKLNDKGETIAIKTSLGEENARKVHISSTKSMTGHLLGAAGGFESVVCALAIERGVVPPTINLDEPDPDCDLDYTANTAKEAKIKACLNNSLGFGGHNATLCFTALS